MLLKTSKEQIAGQEALEYIKKWEGSDQYKRILEYDEYYTTENSQLKTKVKDRGVRGKTPNYFIPTAYYSTLVDTMAGYLFQNIVYDGDEKIIDVLNANDVQVKDMKDGVTALANNRGIEYVYTMGGVDDIKYKFTPIDSLSVTIVWDMSIEPEMVAAIRKYKTDDDAVDFYFDLIHKDKFETYTVKGDKATPVADSKKELLFDEVPVVVYNTEFLMDKSSFNSVLAYIKALDWVVTGNTNELDRIVDAILVLGKKVKQEDRDHMDEWKTLENYATSDRAEFISKDMSPQFREYLSKLLIQEIHKHSHIVDWYSPDSGITGAASGRALKTRLFDMDMFSKRIEMIYREGAQKRIRLLSQVMGLTETVGKVEITFNRSVPSDFEDVVQSLTGVDFLSQETKVRKAGLDWEEEKKRLDSELPSAPNDMFDEE